MLIEKKITWENWFLLRLRFNLGNFYTQIGHKSEERSISVQGSENEFFTLFPKLHKNLYRHYNVIFRKNLFAREFTRFISYFFFPEHYKNVEHLDSSYILLLCALLVILSVVYFRINDLHICQLSMYIFKLFLRAPKMDCSLGFFFNTPHSIIKVCFMFQ